MIPTGCQEGGLGGTDRTHAYLLSSDSAVMGYRVNAQPEPVGWGWCSSRGGKEQGQSGLGQVGMGEWACKDRTGLSGAD